MKKLNALFFILAAFFFCSLLLTCQKESNPSAIKDQQVSFSINISHLKSSPTLKSAMDFSLSSAASIILTIQNADGTPTQYTKTVVKIEQMNGHFYTQALVLKTGPYRLTYFVLTDSTGNTIFASPIAGSLEAQNVVNPLPIEFSVSTNASTSVDVEVLSTEALTPEDFGLITFPIIEVKTFSFLIGVADKETHMLLAAKLTVSNGPYSYIQNLDSVTNNVVTVKDSLSQYTLKIEKTGYITYIHSYPIDSLELFRNAPGNLPLLVEIERYKIPTDGLVAYYPFNGNANDESGNGNNMTVNVATLVADRYGNMNNAYYFNGISDYIEAPSSSSLNIQHSITLVAWFRTNAPAVRPKDGDPAYLIAKHSTNWSRAYSLALDNEQGNQFYDSLCFEVIDINNTFTTTNFSNSNYYSNDWHLLIGTYDYASGFSKIYIDGIMKSIKQIGQVSIMQTNVPLNIGCYDYHSRGFYHGSIDEVRIYNRALNEQEIQALYNEGK